MTRHPGTWLTWAFSAMVVATSTAHPAVTLSTLGVALTLALALPARPDRGALRVVLVVGAIFVLARVTLFTLTGRSGATTFITVPEAQLPALFGGLRFGGRLSLEVFATELADGIRLMAVLVISGSLVALTDIARLVRLMPRSLRRVGVVVQVAVSFLPSLALSAREIRETQTARGIKLKGPRNAVALVVPVLVGAVERAFNLAESLHARGFERETWSRYRPDQLTTTDRIMAGVSIAAAIVGMLVARSAVGSWGAYPVVSWPEVEPILFLAPMLLATPLVLPARSRMPVAQDSVAEGISA